MSNLFNWRSKCGDVLKYVVLVAVFFMFFGSTSTMAAEAASAGGDGGEVATKVICNVIVFVQKLGLPIMTGVILGTSIMAIFGKVSWPAIVMLVVFTGIFFGAGKLMQKFAAGLNTGVSSSTTNTNWACPNG